MMLVAIEAGWKVELGQDVLLYPSLQVDQSGDTAAFGFWKTG